MKSTLVIALLLALLGVLVVRADELQDEIDQAMKKFCGGIQVTAPSTSQVFSNPKQVKVTVSRQPNAQAKVINGVDVYSIDSKGKATYLGTPWKGQYSLNKKATLTVDLTKASGVKFPSQFEFRVWVHNQAGPDCTLMSKTFKVKSSSHSNAAEEAEMAAMNPDIDRGCFGTEITKPALGEHVKATQFSVQITRDSASQVETIDSLDLFRVDLNDRQPVKVQQSFNRTTMIQQVVTFKDSVKEGVQNGYAYFYKLTSTTQHNEKCETFSHPFYIDA